LFGEHAPTRRIRELRSGEDADDVGAAPDLFVESFDRYL